MGSVRSVYAQFRLLISNFPFSLNLLGLTARSDVRSVACMKRVIASPIPISCARKRRGWRLEGEWDRRNLSRKSEVLVRAESLEISHHARLAECRETSNVCVIGQQIMRLEKDHI